MTGVQDYLSNKTVLVTGAAGFIGSHLVETLLGYGATVIGVDNFLTGRQQNIAEFMDHPNFTFIQADVIEYPETYLPSYEQIDLILHFASPASPPRYQAHPVETYLVNSMATHQLLQFMLQHNPDGRFLFASTSEVYGDPQVHPQTESYWGNVNPNGIRSCYDEAKRLGETICGVHQRDFELDIRIVRIFNTYGPKMDPTDGRIIPQFVNQALNNLAYTVYGDGSQTRSYCYVTDLVDGILRLASIDGLAGETVNLGNPGEYTVLETANVIHEVVNAQRRTQHDFTVDAQPLPKDDPTQRKPDITKAQQLLGWEPQVEFRKGLEETIKYFQHSQ
jgi:nucleoside-diphosphate-sugar epimerase